LPGEVPRTLKILTDEQVLQRGAFSWGEVSFAEHPLHNMRRV
jgi:hypothetical protein